MGTADPKAMPTPENRANDSFANILRGIMGGKSAPGGGDLGSWIQDTFRMPAYEGTLSAGPTAGQSEAAGFGANEVSKYYAPGGTSDNITSALTSILQEKGPNTDPNAIAASLDPARQVALKRSLGDMQEQFGTAGLSNSTALTESGARASSDSVANMMADITKMIPQIEGVKVAQGQNRLAAGEQLRGGNLDMAKGGFNIGEGMRSIEDQGMQRQLQEFLRQNNLFPQILSYLAGTPQQPYAPSTLDNILKIGQTGAAIGSVV